MVLFLVHWLVVALGLAAAAYLVPGVTVASGTALAVGGEFHNSQTACS